MIDNAIKTFKNFIMLKTKNYMIDMITCTNNNNIYFVVFFFILIDLIFLYNIINILKKERQLQKKLKSSLHFIKISLNILVLFVLIYIHLLNYKWCSHTCM